MRNKRVADLKADVIGILNDKLSKKIAFHNTKNTLELYKNVEHLAKFEFVNPMHLRLLRTAALFKNIGLISYEDPDNYNFLQNTMRGILGKEKHIHYQKESVKIAEKELPHYQFSPYEINIINDIILGTMKEIGPKTHLGQVFCDADLLYLAKDDFLEKASLFRQELSNLDRRVYSDAEWYDREIEFFRKHKYHLNTSNRLFSEGKSRNLESLISLRKKARVNQYSY